MANRRSIYEADTSLNLKGRNILLFVAGTIVFFYLARSIGFSRSSEEAAVTLPDDGADDNQIPRVRFRVREQETFLMHTELRDMLKTSGYKTMVEIGVGDGDYAFDMLQHCPGIQHYHGIDPFEQQANYIDSANADQASMESKYMQVLNLLSHEFGQERITIIREYSSKAVRLFKTESIDFIYIDGRHDYCAVTEDMESFFPILRCGGLMAGSKYGYTKPALGENWELCANGSRIEGSVTRAVLEFAERHLIPLVEIAEPLWFFHNKC
jgi:predicted O-methyltransferase YrrM